MNSLVFDESVILLDVEADSKETLLDVIGQNLVNQKLVKESYVPAVIARELEFATGLPTAGVSVAIPHTDVEHVLEKTISIAILKEPVDFVIMGDLSETTPVKIVFMLAMDKADDQLTLLQKLMQIFQEADTLTSLANAKDKQTVLEIMQEKLNLPHFERGEK